MRETLYSTLSLIKYLLEYVKKMLYKQYNRFVCISDCSLQLSSRSSAPEHQFVECMQIGPIRAAVEDASAPAREIPLTSFCSAEDRFDVQSIERSLWEPSEQNSHCCRSSSLLSLLAKLVLLLKMRQYSNRIGRGLSLGVHCVL